MSNSELGFDTRLAHVYHCGFAQSPTAGHDCSTLKYKRHTSAWLSGRAQVCSGDICMGPSDYGFDTKFDVVLRDAYGNKLDFQKLSYEQPKFCFEGRKDSEYQLAFVLYRRPSATCTGISNAIQA